jgi:hypothetical protein
MKRVLDVIGILKKLSGQINEASQNPLNIGGNPTLMISPEWMKELGGALDKLGDILVSVIAQAFPPIGPYKVSGEGGWVCEKEGCNRIWSEEQSICTVCGTDRPKEAENETLEEAAARAASSEFS